MNIFKKRETLLQNMTYMALMAAINFIFILLSNFIPFLIFVLVFVLPLVSTVVSVFCKKRYFIIYFTVTIAICIFINLPDTLFYVIPSLITGFIFGIMFENRINPLLTIFITTIVQTILSFGFIAIYKLITGVNIVEGIINILNLQNYKYINFVKYVIFFVLSLIQEGVTFLVLNSQISKFIGEEDLTQQRDEYIILASLFFFSLLTLLFGFILPEFSYLAMCCAIFFTIYQLVHIILCKTKWMLFSLLGSAILTFFVFAALYRSIPEPLGLLSLVLLSFLVGIIVLINNCLVKHKNKI